MAESKKAGSKKAESKKGGISRRDFIKGTGLAVGGVAISSTVLGVACAPKEIIKEVPGQTVVKEVPGQTVVKEVPGQTVVKAPEGVVTLTVNGTDTLLKIQDWWTLAYVLRDKLGLVGTKIGCDEGICGACCVNIDGKPVQSCMTLAIECEGRAITTVEGLQDPKTGALAPVQLGFINESGFMCSYCTSGQIMAANAFLATNMTPTLDQVKEALSNNLCLCGGYELIQKSVLNAATLMKGG